MKRLSYLLSAGVLVAMFAVVGCKKDDGGGPSAVDVAGTNFSGTWAVDGSANSVTYENTDRTDEGYSNFQLVITHQTGTTSGGYVASNFPTGSSPWKSSGNWTFASETPGANSFSVTRDDGVVVNVTVDESQLTLDFEITDPANQTGRTEAVEGDWSFILQKQ
ncbi:hypothetical protein E1176_10130 [Fulvivirga sp. RKSG066]|uniref:hypothetical protein n=1 Tax=Fulvivirga aurantia TaxID=2529383 RepID=UPI0012BC0D40|nr:hypothetical protein [Fulvivirga aurantia]MTI21377.1 hypothetical protein [Fulvivirga aurantia]